MGKGDRKTAKGKRYSSSYGNARKHAVAKAGVAATAAVAAWALPLRLNILVAIASAVAICLLIEHTRGSEPGHAGH